MHPEPYDVDLQELDHLQKLVDGKQASGELPFVTQYEALPGPGCEGDRHVPWRPSARRDLADPELAAILRKACPLLPSLLHRRKSADAQQCADLHSH